MYDAYKRKDLEAILGLLETEIEIYQTTAVPWGGRYRGREGTQQFLGRLMAHVDSVVEIEELFDAGERVVEIGRSLGWVKGTNRKFDVREVHVWELRDGKIASLQSHLDTPAMLAALAP
jgi:uncharacterized protein